jgi:hypothetical protein
MQLLRSPISPAAPSPAQGGRRVNRWRYVAVLAVATTVGLGIGGSGGEVAQAATATSKKSTATKTTTKSSTKSSTKSTTKSTTKSSTKSSTATTKADQSEAGAGTGGGAGSGATTTVAKSAARKILFIPGAGQVLDLGAAAVAKLASGGRVDADVRGAVGLAATGTGTVIVDVTAVSPSQAGKVTLTPVAPDFARSAISATVVFVPGATTVARVAVPVGREGLVRVDTEPGPAGLTVTVVGWVISAPASVNEPSGVALESCRLLDTTTGAGGVPGPLTAARPFDIAATGHGKIPTTSSTTPPSLILFGITVKDIAGAELLVAPTGIGTPELRFAASAGPPLYAVMGVPVGVDPRLAFYTGGTGTLQMSIDAIGWLDRTNVAKSAGPC